MNIKNVKIHNYKGFYDLSINFHPRLNVFIGSNASGKTSLLKAIMCSINNTTQMFARNSSQELTLTNSDITYGEIYCSIINTIENFPGYENDFFSIVRIQNVVGSFEPELDPKIAASRDKFIKWFRNQISTSTQTVPIVKLYPANRGAIKYDSYISNNSYQITQLETWSNIFQNSISYSRFFKWFFDNETNELRLQRDYNDFTTQSPDLKGVRYALEAAFNLLGYGKVVVKTNQVRRQKNAELTPTLIVENIDTKKIDEIDNKSDGEKAIITLIADIAYNLSLAKDFTFDEDFLNSPGVVVIDEIENHLHPNWQREIVPILTGLFPNIQFFIATHSPQIISSINSENIFLCQDFQIEKINLKTKGEDSNTLLKYIFNSTERPKQYIELLNEFDFLLESNAGYAIIEAKINEIAEVEKQDKAKDIDILVDRLKLQFEAYKFDREYDINK